MQYVIQTQILENYGAHSEDGKYANGNAYWKFKGGNDFLVSDVNSKADAMAFVAAICDNTIYWKEFPTNACTYDEWKESISFRSDDYQTYLVESLKEISPLNRRAA